MIRKKEDIEVEMPKKKFGAPGFITVRNLIESNEELNGHGRVFAHTTVLPGNGIGYHIHQNESELYYIYSGKGIYNDNGIEVEVSSGDVTICFPGEGHGMMAAGEDPLELIALILHN